jgi:hypothetical protein
MEPCFLAAWHKKPSKHVVLLVLLLLLLLFAAVVCRSVSRWLLL